MFYPGPLEGGVFSTGTRYPLEGGAFSTGTGDLLEGLYPVQEQEVHLRSTGTGGPLEEHRNQEVHLRAAYSAQEQEVHFRVSYPVQELEVHLRQNQTQED